MKTYKFLIHNGLAFAVSVYGTNKKQIEKEYREQWNLQGKRLNISIW
jgi:hypothetical protein